MVLCEQVRGMKYSCECTHMCIWEMRHTSAAQSACPPHRGAQSTRRDACRDAAPGHRLLTDFCRCLRSCDTASIWRFFSAARSLVFCAWTCFEYAFCSRALRLRVCGRVCRCG